MTDPQFVLDKIDWEGWPDALEWLFSEDFGDEYLNQLIYDATITYNTLANFRDRIERRVEELLDGG